MDLSPAALLAALVTSSLGFGIFLYGKKQRRFPQLAVGVALMVYPFFVAGALALWGVGAALLLALFVAVRLGL